MAKEKEKVELAALSCVVKEFEMSCCAQWESVKEKRGCAKQRWVTNRSFFRERRGVDGVHQVLCCVAKEEGVECYSPQFGLSPVAWRPTDLARNYQPCSEEEGKEAWLQLCQSCAPERVVVVEGSYVQLLDALRSFQSFGFVPHLCRVLLEGEEVGRGLRISVEMACGLKRLDEARRKSPKEAKRLFTPICCVCSYTNCNEGS